MLSPLTIVTRRGCPYCQRAHDMLAEAGVPYEEVSIDDMGENGDDYLAQLSQRTGLQTVPQVFDAEGKFLGDSRELEMLLLTELFAQADDREDGERHREAAEAFVDMCGGWN